MLPQCGQTYCLDSEVLEPPREDVEGSDRKTGMHSVSQTVQVCLSLLVACSLSM